MPETAARIVLYERDGCHLCDEARELLDATIGPDGYRRVDIDADDDLVLRYGYRVPVISVNGEDRLKAPISRPDLVSLLRAVDASEA
ncbi:MAG: glutaredoxin family protein [Chloroflexota bacterium]|nr:glutaredoxin family protein [Chloroflexota bacterium]